MDGYREILASSTTSWMRSFVDYVASYTPVIEIFTDIVKKIALASSTIGSSFGIILFLYYTRSNGVPFPISVSTLLPIAVVTALVTFAIAIGAVVMFALPLLNRISKADRRVFSYISMNTGSAFWGHHVADIERLLRREVSHARSLTAILSYMQVYGYITASYLAILLYIVSEYFYPDKSSVILALALPVPCVLFLYHIIVMVNSIKESKRSSRYYELILKKPPKEELPKQSETIPWLYFNFAYSFGWYSFVMLFIGLKLQTISVDDNYSTIYETMSTISIIILPPLVHYLLYRPGSHLNSKQVAIFAVGLVLILFFLQGAAALAGNTLRMLGIGGGTEIKLYMNKNDFETLPMDLRETKSDVKLCPCSTMRLILLLDVGTSVYVQKINDATPNASKSSKIDGDGRGTGPVYEIRRNTIITLEYSPKDTLKN